MGTPLHPIWGGAFPNATHHFLPQPPRFWPDGVRGERGLTHPVRPEIAASGFLFATLYTDYFLTTETSNRVRCSVPLETSHEMAQKLDTMFSLVALVNRPLRPSSQKGTRRNDRGMRR